MIEANELNSTFYALRLLSHALDTSEIEVAGGEEYPAAEFTREEQKEALKIIRRIEDLELASVKQLPSEKVAFYLTSLADRIEELANSDLANAGYNLRLPSVPSFQVVSLSDPVTPVELTPQLEALTQLMAEIDPQSKKLIELRFFEGLTQREIAEALDIPLATVSTKLAEAHAFLRRKLIKRGLNQAEAKVEGAIPLNDPNERRRTMG